MSFKNGFMAASLSCCSNQLIGVTAHHSFQELVALLLCCAPPTFKVGIKGVAPKGSPSRWIDAGAGPPNTGSEPQQLLEFVLKARWPNVTLVDEHQTQLLLSKALHDLLQLAARFRLGDEVRGLRLDEGATRQLFDLDVRGVVRDRHTRQSKNNRVRLKPTN
ncbi:MAG: hypothetical protein K2W93_03140 [Burkholderiaceae bacterium]|nr:hypothetical protein [Burkholderiaceae bacterium]